jgi:hypothetical protein
VNGLKSLFHRQRRLKVKKRTIRVNLILLSIGTIFVSYYIGVNTTIVPQVTASHIPTTIEQTRIIQEPTNALDPVTLDLLTANGGGPATEETASSLGDPFLNQLAEDTWAYLSSDWARSNSLPWSWRSETLSGGNYANTAEIGFLALAWLAAYDINEPWSPSWNQAETEVTAILDQLRAWQDGSQSQQPNGPNAYENSVFYQWYWISEDPPVVSGNADDHLVPSIDNAWLAVSLIVIREYAFAH